MFGLIVLLCGSEEVVVVMLVLLLGGMRHPINVTQTVQAAESRQADAQLLWHEGTSTKVSVQALRSHHSHKACHALFGKAETENDFLLAFSDLGSLPVAYRWKATIGHPPTPARHRTGPHKPPKSLHVNPPNARAIHRPPPMPHSGVETTQATRSAPPGRPICGATINILYQVGKLTDWIGEYREKEYRKSKFNINRVE